MSVYCERSQYESFQNGNISLHLSPAIWRSFLLFRIACLYTWPSVMSVFALAMLGYHFLSSKRHG